MGTVMSNIVAMQPYPGHPLRALKQFAADADHLVWRYNELNDLWAVTYEKIEATKNGEQITELIAAAKKIATLNQLDQATLAQCEAALQRFDPETNYEDDGQGNLKPSVIAARIAVLVGSFPNGAPSDPAVFVRMLIDAVSSVEYLSLPTLDAAIWEIVETKKFVPTISEVLEIVRKQQSGWGKRFCAIHEIAETASWALEEIAELAVKRDTGTEPEVR
jgi:hypothetical protein